MSGPSPADASSVTPQPPGDDRTRLESLVAYLVAQGERFTPGALGHAAAEAGYTPTEIDAAMELAEVRRQADTAARPVRARARWLVLAAYALTYLAFAVGFLSGPKQNDPYGIAVVALAVLTGVLGLALLISILWVNRRRVAASQLQGAMVALVALPFVLLVAVAGLCVVTTSSVLLGPAA